MIGWVFESAFIYGKWDKYNYTTMNSDVSKNVANSWIDIYE